MSQPSIYEAHAAGELAEQHPRLAGYLGLLAENIEAYDAGSAPVDADATSRIVSHFARFLGSDAAPTWPELKAAVSRCFGDAPSVWDQRMAGAPAAMFLVLRCFRSMHAPSADERAARLLIAQLDSAVHTAMASAYNIVPLNGPSPAKPALPSGSIGAVTPLGSGSADFYRRTASTQVPTPGLEDEDRDFSREFSLPAPGPAPRDKGKQRAYSPRVSETPQAALGQIAEMPLGENGYMGDDGNGGNPSRQRSVTVAAADRGRSSAPSLAPREKEEEDDGDRDKPASSDSSASPSPSPPNTTATGRPKRKSTVTTYAPDLGSDEDDVVSDEEGEEGGSGGSEYGGSDDAMEAAGGNGSGSGMIDLLGVNDLVDRSSTSRRNATPGPSGQGRSPAAHAAAAQARSPRRRGALPSTGRAGTGKKQKTSATDPNSAAKSLKLLPSLLKSLAPAQLDNAGPPAGFDVSNRNLLFSRANKSNHLAGKTVPTVNTGMSKGVYSMHKNLLCIKPEMNICGFEGKMFEPGAPVAFIGRLNKIKDVRSSMSDLSTQSGGKRHTGINLFVHLPNSSPSMWRYMGWYDVLAEGAEPIQAGPGALDRMHPDLQGIFRQHLKYSRPEVRALQRGEEITRMTHLLESWGFNARTPTAALLEVEDPNRVGAPLAMRYLILRCTGFKDECYSKWDQRRTAMPVGAK